MYDTVVRLFALMSLGLTVSLAVGTIGLTAWNWIDDNEYDSVLLKLNKYIGFRVFFNIDNIGLELVIIFIVFIVTMFGAFLWPLWLLIIVSVFARKLRREQKEKQSEG